MIVVNGIEAKDLYEMLRSIVRDEMAAAQVQAKPEKIKPYLSVDDLSELTGWSKSIIYKGTSAGTIPHLKRGKLLFKRDEIIQWLESGRAVEV